jgi:hypothetical protein
MLLRDTKVIKKAEAKAEAEEKKQVDISTFTLQDNLW